MFVRIDPAIPVVWRDTDTVQIGLDPVRAHVGPLDMVQARGIAELVRGTSMVRLASVVGGAANADALVTACGDVFHPPSRATLPRLAIVGGVAATDVVARIWAGAAHSIVVAPSSADLGTHEFDLVLLVSHFVVSPIEVQPWLGSDVPHCALVFGESSVRVGPVVIPGVTPCVRCVELAHVDTDPAWSAVAPQVWRKAAASDSRFLAVHAAAESLAMFPMGGGYSVRVDAVDFRREVSPHALHPRCGCQSIDTFPE